MTYAQQDITALNRTVAKVFEELTFENVMDWTGTVRMGLMSQIN